MIIGIDPGYTGAISFLWGVDNNLAIHDMPICQYNGRKVVDGSKLAALLQRMVPEILGATGVIEDVHAMPEQGVTSTFRFGYGAGVVRGVLDALGIPVLMVKPGVWKMALNLSSDKKQSLALAKTVFPLYEHYFRRQKDDGRAEAALIAYHAKQCLF